MRRKILRSVLICSICAVPTAASASVLITEFMYDLEGADAGYEWVEVTNTGNTSVDIGEWRFFEQGTNHRLELFAGAVSMLAPGQSAIIADKPSQFLARYPGIEPVFDSAFSLSNEGETLMLKNAAGIVVDQLTYRSSLGAAGDGASLHLDGLVLRPAMPNPGVYPGELVPVQTHTNSEDESSTGLPADAAYAAVGAAPVSNTAPLLPWLVGLVSIIGVGVAGTLLVKTEQKREEETKVRADEFEIEV